MLRNVVQVLPYLCTCPEDRMQEETPKLRKSLFDLVIALGPLECGILYIPSKNKNGIQKVHDDDQYLAVVIYAWDRMHYHHRHAAVLQLMGVGHNQHSPVCYIPPVGQVEGY